MLPLFLSLTIEQSQYIGWGVALLTTLLGVIAAAYFGRKLRPAEKAAIDLQTLTAYKDSLEKQVERLSIDLRETTKELKGNSEKLTTITTQLDHIHGEVDRLQKINEGNIGVISTLNDRLLEAQVIAQIMRTQRDKIVRQFKLPTNVSDL